VCQRSRGPDVPAPRERAPYYYYSTSTSVGGSKAHACLELRFTCGCSYLTTVCCLMLLSTCQFASQRCIKCCRTQLCFSPCLFFLTIDWLRRQCHVQECEGPRDAEHEEFFDRAHALFQTWRGQAVSQHWPAVLLRRSLRHTGHVSIGEHKGSDRVLTTCNKVGNLYNMQHMLCAST